MGAPGSAPAPLGVVGAGGGALRKEEEMELLTARQFTRQKRRFHTGLLALGGCRVPGTDPYGLVQRPPALHALLWLNSP